MGTNKKDLRSPFEVVLSSKETGLYKTELISAISLKIAEKKAEEKFSELFNIHDVHAKG